MRRRFSRRRSVVCGRRSIRYQSALQFRSVIVYKRDRVTRSHDVQRVVAFCYYRYRFSCRNVVAAQRVVTRRRIVIDERAAAYRHNRIQCAQRLRYVQHIVLSAICSFGGERSAIDVYNGCILPYFNTGIAQTGCIRSYRVVTAVDIQASFYRYRYTICSASTGNSTVRCVNRKFCAFVDIHTTKLNVRSGDRVIAEVQRQISRNVCRITKRDIRRHVDRMNLCIRQRRCEFGKRFYVYRSAVSRVRRGVRSIRRHFRYRPSVERIVYVVQMRLSRCSRFLYVCRRRAVIVFRTRQYRLAVLCIERHRVFVYYTVVRRCVRCIARYFRNSRTPSRKRVRVFSRRYLRGRNTFINRRRAFRQELFIQFGRSIFIYKRDRVSRSHNVQRIVAFCYYRYRFSCHYKVAAQRVVTRRRIVIDERAAAYRHNRIQCAQRLRYVQHIVLSAICSFGGERSAIDVYNGCILPYFNTGIAQTGCIRSYRVVTAVDIQASFYRYRYTICSASTGNSTVRCVNRKFCAFVDIHTTKLNVRSGDRVIAEVQRQISRNVCRITKRDIRRHVDRMDLCIRKRRCEFSNRRYTRNSAAFRVRRCVRSIRSYFRYRPSVKRVVHVLRVRFRGISGFRYICRRRAVIVFRRREKYGFTVFIHEGHRVLVDRFGVRCRVRSVTRYRTDCRTPSRKRVRVLRRCRLVRFRESNVCR